MNPSTRTTVHLAVATAVMAAVGAACSEASDDASGGEPFPDAVPMDSTPRTTTPASAPPDGSIVIVTDVVDGDTIDTSIGTVRIIGYDAPEVGQPCHDEAARRLEQLVAAGRVTVVAEPERDVVDGYGRLLRHVYVTAEPVGAILIADDLAVARYDSEDGYGWHRHEAEYRRLSDGVVCVPALVTSTTTTSPPPAPPPAAGESPVPSRGANDNPYDDGGPRNPDGSCPPGGCLPGT